METQIIRLENPFHFVKFYETKFAYYYATSDGRVLKKSKVSRDEHYLAIHDYKNSKVVSIDGKKMFLKDIIINSFFSTLIKYDHKVYFADGNSNNLSVDNICVVIPDYKKVLHSYFDKGNRLQRKKIR